MDKKTYLKKLLDVIGKETYKREDVENILELVLGQESRFESVGMLGDKEIIVDKSMTGETKVVKEVDPLLDQIINIAKTPLKGNAAMVQEDKI